MTAGKRDCRIVVERAQETGRDVMNAPIFTWTPYTTVYAALFYGTGTEQRAASQVQATLIASMEVLANPKTRTISVTDRILWDGALWNIRSVAPVGRHSIRLNAERDL